MATLVEKLSDVRDFRKILETTVKEIGENYSSELCQIILSNPLDNNFTSICEYQANPEDPQYGLPYTSFPLHLEGGGLGLLNVCRRDALDEGEVNEIRITLANISDILRYAQINDLVQRDTFRSAFMSEISNLMSLPMGLGDALFMVVNILGKALACSRCVFICVDDSHSTWRSYEYFQRERVESAQDFGFPAKDSPIVSQTLLSAVPIVYLEGQPNSYKTPVQEEMEFIGVRSQLSVALRSSIAVHGCIILQQCESRHAWTRDEVDMVQGVADTVAEALAQLPEEKKTSEPIMRLYQHDVAESKPEGQLSAQERRKALKGALGQAAIPKAQKSREPGSEAKAAPPPPPKPMINFAPEALQQGPEGMAAHAEIADTPSLSQGQGWTHEEGAPSPIPEPQAAPGWQADAGAGVGAQASWEDSSWQGENQEAGWEGGNWQEQAETAAANASWQETAAPQEPDWDNAGLEYQEPAESAPWQHSAESQDAQEEGTENPETPWGPPPGAEAPTGILGMAAAAIEQEASQMDSGDGQPGNFKGVLGGLLGNQRKAQSLDIWGVETSQEQPPSPGGPESAAARQGQRVPPVPTVPGAPMAPQLPPAPPIPPASAHQQDPAASEMGSGGKWGDLDSIQAPGARANAEDASQGGKWGNLDSIAAPGSGAHPAASAASAGTNGGGKWGDLDAIQSPQAGGRGQSKWGDLDAIPGPQGQDPGARTAAAPGAGRGPGGSTWGNLDAIPAPANASKAGLGAMMLGKAKASAVATNTGLGGSLHKGGVKPPAPPSAYVEGPPIQIDEAAAEAKLKQILASSNPTSDYIFATPGVDMRLLGRIDGWVNQVESKDKHLHGHARALAEYATAVARLFELPQETVNEIRLAAIVHDVGKLGLPQNILQKPEDELTDSELVMIMNHPIQGAKLLEGFPELKAIAPIVIAHHEEYDGNGYPEGLAGENIPLEARIIHACNSYVEMVSDLVYRAGMPPAQAQNQMIQGAGSTYDPNVVEALIACISQGVVPDRII